MVWEASSVANQQLNGTVSVLDDRSDPKRNVGWVDPTSAIGTFPFLSSHSLDTYANDTTGWLIAGPSFSGGGIPQTSVAFTPLGIRYP